MNTRLNLATLLATAALLVACTPAALAAPMARPAAHNADGWTSEERAILLSMRLSQLPADTRDPSNAYERLPSAVELGRRLFNDTRFSANQKVACATCHDPARQFQDGLPVAQGVGTGSRRLMPVVGLAHGSWLFWDGRKDSAWSQALGPLEDSVEHGGNRVRYAHQLAAYYRDEYESLFGPMPDLSGLPAQAGPFGADDEKAAWRAMDDTARLQVNRVFANLGKAIAAFEKSLRHPESRLDRYLDAMQGKKRNDGVSLTKEEANGLRLFIGKGQCVSCHNGPLFTDQQFHNTGVPPRAGKAPDRGRAAALAKVREDEFNCLGRYSDAKPEQCVELRFMVAEDASLEGAFKTPGLRGVALRAPYMHAGQVASLEEVVRHYVAAPHAALGHSELNHTHPIAPPKKADHVERAPIALTDAEQHDLVSFLKTLH